MTCVKPRVKKKRDLWARIPTMNDNAMKARAPIMTKAPIRNLSTGEEPPEDLNSLKRRATANGVGIITEKGCVTSFFQ